MDKLKLCVVGPPEVGKTSIINNFIFDTFNPNYNPTIGIDFVSRDFASFAVKLQLWDTAGQTRFHNLIPSYFKGSTAVIFVYDITRKESLDQLNLFIQMARQTEEDTSKKFLVGNKSDLQDQRQISQEEGMQFCQNNSMDGFYEISARSKPAIQQMFCKMLSIVTGKGSEEAIKQLEEKMKKKEEQIKMQQEEEKKKKQAQDEKIREQERIRQQEIERKRLEEEAKQAEIDKFINSFADLDISEVTLKFFEKERINRELLQFMTRSDVQGLSIPIGDQFRIIKKLDKK